MFIDFEGIEGSGQSALSVRVAERLRAHGYRVTHLQQAAARQPTALQRLGALTREAEGLALSPEALHLLGLARQAQARAELLGPALARGEVCISAGDLPGQLALAPARKGPGAQALSPGVDLAAAGIWPDLVVLLDVDVELAAARRALAHHALEPLSAAEAGEAGRWSRMREGLLAQARADAARWMVVRDEGVSPRVLEERVFELVRARLEGREPPVERILPPLEVAPLQGLEEVEARLFEVLAGLTLRESALAALLLEGLPGPRAHQLRLAVLEEHPSLVALSLRGLADAESVQLRALLSETRPAEVLRSLAGDASPEAMALRARLFSRAPAAALRGLCGNDAPEAWGLRLQGLGEGRLAEVLAGLAFVDSERAWAVRAQGLEAGLAAEVARSLTGVAGPWADTLREALLAETRLAVLESTRGLTSPVCWTVRERLLPHAPGAVLHSLGGVDGSRADTLRWQWAPSAPEALEATAGLDTTAAWALRATHLARLPATTLASLRGTPPGPKRLALVRHALTLAPTHPLVLRHAFLLTRPEARRPGAREVHPTAELQPGL